MLHSDHIKGTETFSYLKAHHIFTQLKSLAKENNLSQHRIKLLTKKEIISKCLGAADAMIIWEDAPEDWLNNFNFIQDNFVYCINEENSLSFYDI